VFDRDFAGLLNVDDSEFVAGLLLQAGSDLNIALSQPSQTRKARLLVRFLTALVVPGVVQPAAAFSLLEGLVNAALRVASSPGGDDDGRTWQPYTDSLVYMALMALPFGGPELAEALPERLTGLLDIVDAYMAKRPRSTQPALRPFAAAVKDDDILAEYASTPRLSRFFCCFFQKCPVEIMNFPCSSAYFLIPPPPLFSCRNDSAAASFLPEVLEAIKEIVSSGNWILQSVPRVHVAFEATLATANENHALLDPVVPVSVPVEFPEGGSNSLLAALVLDAYPPRGIIHFLDPQHTQGDRQPIERLVAEDYILDMVAWFEGDRVEAAQRLARNIPLPYSYEPLLCEVLFSQMLRLPLPEFKPVMYSTLMVDLCKLQRLFPRAMSACMRECFARMNVMDPALRERLAEWLAYHLSNFDYVWPWTKWEHVLQAPLYDGQRRFCVAVMNRMVRLSFWDKVQSTVPEEFRVLMPPKPEVAVLPTFPATPSIEDAAASSNDEIVWAIDALKLVRAKTSAQDLDDWIKAKELEQVLGGKIGVLRMLSRCLLVAGAKSYSHLVTAIERYHGPLSLLVNEIGMEGQIALVEMAALVFEKNPQRIVMAVDKLMQQRHISAEAIVSWVFGADGVRCIQDQSKSGVSWEILQRAVDKTMARVQDASDEFIAVKAMPQPGEAVTDPSIAEKKSYFEESIKDRNGALMQVLRSFVAALGPGGFAASTNRQGEDETSLDIGATEGTVLREYMIASLRSFLRRYHVQVAEIEEDIRKDVLSCADTQAKEVIESQLQL